MWRKPYCSFDEKDWTARHRWLSAQERPREDQQQTRRSDYPNLLKGKTIDHANQVWTTDITYLRCAGEWVYLAAVLDMHLHKIVGWLQMRTVYLTSNHIFFLVDINPKLDYRILFRFSIYR